MSLGLVGDKPTVVSDRHQFEAMLANTVKPVVFTAHDRAGMQDIMAMAAASRGGADVLEREPSICLYAEPSTPLRHTGNAAEKLLLAAEQRVPAIYTPCPMAGGTAPASLAGALVVGIAESLSGLVIHQLKRPGAPFITGGVISVMDMRAAILSYGAPELSLMSAALTDMAHHYRLPMFSTAGCSDSKAMDEQAAAEATMSIMVAALSGANLIHDIGFLEAAMCGSMELTVFSDEVIGMAKRILGAIPMGADDLALEVIEEEGHPSPGFVSSEHTVRNMKRDIYYSDFVGRVKESYEDWYEKAHARVKEVLTAKCQDPQAKREMEERLAALGARLKEDDTTWRTGTGNWWKFYVQDLC